MADNHIPRIFRAGDTLNWTETHSSYPAPTWTAKYRLSGAAQHTFTSTASGSSHKFSITATTTAAIAKGYYQATGWVENASGERYTLFAGTIEVLENLAALVGAQEGRTHLLKVFEAIKAMIEGRASKAQQQITIQGRQLAYLSPSELIKWYNFYRSEVERELKAERIAAGENAGNNVLTRFVSP